MIQYRVEFQDLAEILKDHFDVEGLAKIDVALTYKAGQAAEGDGPPFPTILTQITGIILTVEEPPPAVSRTRRRRGQPKRRPRAEPQEVRP